jgi:uncharacterized delta-60 repeat protein
MKNTFTSLLRNPSIFFFAVILSPIFLQAQNPGTPDKSIGLGTFNGEVKDIKVQSDGKILVAGDFTYYKTVKTNGIVRLNPDGSVDNSFNIGSGAIGAGYSGDEVNAIAIQVDGKIIIGGNFILFNGNNINRVARLNYDGSLDNTFNIGSGECAKNCVKCNVQLTV